MGLTHGLLTAILTLSGPLLTFSVDELHLQEKSVAKPESPSLGGEISAREFLLRTSQGQIQLSPQDGGLAIAQISLEGQKLKVRQGDLLLSSNIPGENGLEGLKNLKLSRADFSMDDKNVQGELQRAEVSHQQQHYLFKNIQLDCRTGGDFNLNVLSTCFRTGELKPTETSKAQLTIETQTPKNENPLNLIKKLDLNFSSLQFSEKDFQFSSQALSIDFTNQNELRLGPGEVLCQKHEDFGKGPTIDPDLFLQSCQKDSHGTLRWVEFSEPQAHYAISRAKHQLGPKKLTLQAQSARLTQSPANPNSENRVTTLQKAVLNCNRIETHEREDLDFLEGCLKRAQLKVKALGRSEGLSLNLEHEKAPVQKVKDLQVSAKNNDVVIEGLLSSMVPIPFYIRGPAKLLREKRELHFTIEQASVFGLPATSLVVYLLESVVLPEQIQLDGRNITLYL